MILLPTRLHSGMNTLPNWQCASAMCLPEPALKRHISIPYTIDQMLQHGIGGRQYLSNTSPIYLKRRWDHNLPLWSAIQHHLVATASQEDEEPSLEHHTSRSLHPIACTSLRVTTAWWQSSRVYLHVWSSLCPQQVPHLLLELVKHWDIS